MTFRGGWDFKNWKLHVAVHDIHHFHCDSVVGRQGLKDESKIAFNTQNQHHTIWIFLAGEFVVLAEWWFSGGASEEQWQWIQRTAMESNKDEWRERRMMMGDEPMLMWVRFTFLSNNSCWLWGKKVDRVPWSQNMAWGMIRMSTRKRTQSGGWCARGCFWQDVQRCQSCQGMLEKTKWSQMKRWCCQQCRVTQPFATELGVVAKVMAVLGVQGSLCKMIKSASKACKETKRVLMDSTHTMHTCQSFFEVSSSLAFSWLHSSGSSHQLVTVPFLPICSNFATSQNPATSW